MTDRPLILLIFANDQRAYLDSIPKERQRLMELLRTEGDKLNLEVDSLDYTTIEGIIKALNLQRERLAVLHFAGHSNTDLLQLDEGKAHAKGLADKLGECPNLKLVFLNGCNNSTLVKAIINAGIPSVIGTRQAVADEAARYFSNGFFTALASQHSTLAEAFHQAQTDVATLTGQHYRSLDLRSPSTTPDWAWFMESQQPDWRLAKAAHPCNRLPALAHGELPAKPFKNLYYYTEDDAEIFFGRCQAILDVLQLLDDAKEPVLLLHGGTGVGKSSFLLAGLIPRLKAPSRQQVVQYLRYNERDPEKNLLQQLFGSTDPITIRNRLNTPTAAGLPAVWIIDQLEEIFFAEQQQQLDTLLTTLHTVFYPEETRPKAKLILSLRKEWFADLLDASQKYKINVSRYLLNPLDKLSIIEVIQAPVETTYLRQNYNLNIQNPPDGQLAAQIADDLLTDKQSNIAPTLQIILSRLWDRVENQHNKVWNEELYLNEKKSGLLLEDYLNQQLQDIAEKESWGKEAKESGLLLDVLYSHTTIQGTAKTLTTKEYKKYYSHIKYHTNLINTLKNHHLIIDLQTNPHNTIEKQTRIAHDTIAQQIKINHEQSELPGTRARKILDLKSSNNNKNDLLSKIEYKEVKKGLIGTRKTNEREELLIRKSKGKILGINIFKSIAILLVIFFSSIAILLIKNNDLNNLINISNEFNLIESSLEKRTKIENKNTLENINNLISEVSPLDFPEGSFNYFKLSEINYKLYGAKIYYINTFNESCYQKNECISMVKDSYNKAIVNTNKIIDYKKPSNLTKNKFTEFSTKAKIHKIRISLIYSCTINSEEVPEKEKLYQIIKEVSIDVIQDYLGKNEPACVTQKFNHFIEEKV